jgi:hypothetical protein
MAGSARLIHAPSRGKREGTHETDPTNRSPSPVDPPPLPGEVVNDPPRCSATCRHRGDTRKSAVEKIACLRQRSQGSAMIGRTKTGRGQYACLP